jgi:protein tyrosine phosphatase
MNIFEKLQKDFSRSLKEGLGIVKERGVIVSKRLGELTEEGKRKYDIFSLNMKMQEEFARLGGEVYALSSKKSLNTLTNRKVRSLILKIQRLEKQVSKLEKKVSKKLSSPTPARKTSRRGSKSK